MRINVSSESPWEQVVGFSRAVRIDEHVAVSGTVGSNPDGTPVHPTDIYAQAIKALERIDEALAIAGAERRHVVRTRMYVTDIQRWEEVAKAHREFFGEIMPTTSMIEVKGFIRDDLLVEIEADAIIY
jgi:enamine deaminase RidA (YjgF/YER057c/UK114 family)